jgi:Ca2+-binding EF-hand superfamily protein
MKPRAGSGEFEKLPPRERDEYRKVFTTLAVSSAGDASKLVVTEAALPHLCRVMNMALPEELLVGICDEFGSSASASGKTTPAQSLASSGVPRIPQPTEFTWEDVVSIYDHFYPSQRQNLTLFLQLFNLLDVNEVGSIHQNDLRHALCSVGDRLSEEEFNHLLYTNDILHKSTITVYEFVRLLLRVLPSGDPN